MVYFFKEMFSVELETRRRAQGVRRSSPTTPNFPPEKDNQQAVHCEAAVLPVLLWVANLVLIAVAPLVMVYGTVLPVLDESLPFLAQKVPVPVDVTVVLQLLFVGWMLVRTCQFYRAQVAVLLNHREGVWSFFHKWCPHCAAEVAHHASHCGMCGECVEKRRFHSLLLNTCVGEGDMHEANHLALLSGWSKDCFGMLLIFALEALLGGPLRVSHVLFSWLALFAAEQHAQALKEQQAQQWRRPGDSLHLHAE